MLEVTEQMLVKDRPDGQRLYMVDGNGMLMLPAAAEHLRALRERIIEFVKSVPQMENYGDQQDYTREFCADVKLPVPCFGEWCAGGCDDPQEGCDDWEDKS